MVEKKFNPTIEHCTQFLHVFRCLPKSCTISKQISAFTLRGLQAQAYCWVFGLPWLVKVNVRNGLQVSFCAGFRVQVGVTVEVKTRLILLTAWLSQSHFDSCQEQKDLFSSQFELHCSKSKRTKPEWGKNMLLTQNVIKDASLKAASLRTLQMFLLLYHSHCFQTCFV